MNNVTIYLVTTPGCPACSVTKPVFQSVAEQALATDTVTKWAVYDTSTDDWAFADEFDLDGAPALVSTYENEQGETFGILVSESGLKTQAEIEHFYRSSIEQE